MRKNPITLITLLLLTCSVRSQTVYLKSGNISPEKNINASSIERFNTQLSKNAAPELFIIQFSNLPATATRQALATNGIVLEEYIPDQAWLASIRNLPAADALQQWGVQALVPCSPAMKMLPALYQGRFPAHAVKISGTVDLWINWVPSYTYEQVSRLLKEKNFDIISSQFKSQQVLSLRISAARLLELAALPIISYIEPAPAPPQLFNDISKGVSKANVLGKDISAGGRGLKGSGVTIGIGDDADPQHVDFTGRLIHRAAIVNNFHGTHVTGTAGGAGIWNERYTGHAPKATLLSQAMTGIWTNAPTYVNDYRMVITNNSYGNITTDCAYSGFYDNYSRILDQQAFSLPKLINTFAAGNSGIGFPLDCTPFPAGYKSVVGGYQASKNVITVGNVYADGVIFPQSSRGPVKDGRLKPEVCADGAFVMSCATAVNYAQNTGTSMANPSVAGTLALLYERYRQLNGPASDPDNALVKALLCNTATDKGTAGPDYTYGFGIINGLRAVENLEAGNYVQNSISTGGDNTFDITVPANTAQLKVMLYYNDPAAAPVAARALVNDLDLRLTTTAPATYRPLILDSSASGCTLPAVQGIDQRNNIEQVVIDNPTGTYTVHVAGTAVPVNGPQAYYVTYDIVPISATLTYPTGGERLVPGDVVVIYWDAFGGAPENFTLELSTNNGGTWSTLSNAVPAGQRYFVWTVPNTPTTQAMVRLTKNNTALVSTSGAFTILGAPTVSLSAVQCESYVSVDWTAVPAATQYEIMMLQGNDMVSVATVPAATSTYSIGGLSVDSVYWVSVRAIMSGVPGRRGEAVFRQPNSGACTGGISDNDIKVAALRAPAASGRKFTSTELGAAVTVAIDIKNLDDQPSSGNIDVSYSINGTLQETQTIAPAIAAGGTYTHSFTVPANLSVAGNYSFEVQAVKAGDPVTSNNTLLQLIKQLPNDPVSLPFTDNFDAAPVQVFNRAQMGLQGLDRYDFVSSTIYGQVRSFINTGIAYSGNRALTIDAERYMAGNTDSLTGTYNIDLTGYNPLTDEIRIDFRYKNHGQVANAANAVWIRGADTDPWKPAYDLFANQNPADGTYKYSGSIELSDLLAAAPTQNITTSLQVRWGQYGQYQATDNSGGAGYTFDDVRIYKVTDDLQMISIDAPVTAACGLTASSVVTISVRNSSNAVVTNVPVRFRVDGGAWNNESISSIAANTTIAYSFTTGANLAAFGPHLVETEVLYPTDTFHDNDTASKRIVNAPVVNSFPYLEDFESSDGYFYTGGRYSSWEYGTPAANKITRAASGSKAWKTRLQGTYTDNELSYLYSPCFNVSALTNPTLSFSLALDIEDCGGTLCDGAYVEYSLDGTTWSRLGAQGQGTNWYNKNYSGNTLWSTETYSRWHVATIPLSVTGVPIVNMTQIRFRFVMSADPGLDKDGIAVDDIHVYDNINGIYDGATMGAPVTQTINAGTNNWVDFLQGGKLVASIHPAGYEMGATDVRAYINAGAVRYTGYQYYHDRNLTIQPGISFLTLPDSVRVRFYFLDTETEALLNATGCANCTKPTMAYELGVSKYSDPDNNFENGTLVDDNQGVWTFINAANARKVPFDKGYYAEFKVNNFSELWLNNGGVDYNTPLPLQLVSFTARKLPGTADVIAEWVTASEFNVSHFELQVARGNAEYQAGRFTAIGTVSSQGNATTEQRYQFTDREIAKAGVRYYRLRIVDRDGAVKYSAVRPVVFQDEIKWQVHPNPSAGLFTLWMQASSGEEANLRVIDLGGRVIRTMHITANGFVQKIPLNLESTAIAPGYYLLDIRVGNRQEQFRLLKQ